MLARLTNLLEWLLVAATCALILTQSTPRPIDDLGRVQVFTHQIEFDYVSWMLGAIRVKLEQGAAGLPGYMDRENGKQAVMEYLRVTQQILEGEAALQRVYADASIRDKESASSSLRANLDRQYARQKEVAPLAEAVLQEQVAEVLAEQGLTTFGQPLPGVLYHFSPVPNALIVSRRSKIEQLANISVRADLPIDEQELLEYQVDKAMNVSSLVVPIGGVGVYPTMVMETTSLSWVVDTIAHEWTHNYLNLRPLGLQYDKTPAMRTMNETTASIAGGEVGKLVMQRFYPEQSAESEVFAEHPRGAPLQHGGRGSRARLRNLVSHSLDHPDPGELPRPLFDFRAEMHTTRVTTDELLAQGKIDKAEAYMRDRQQIFLKNGYLLRKLNQAYFAFYGAYADVPGGAAGEDPVGPAVRALREKSPSLEAFINRIAWMSSFDDLRNAVGEE